MPPEIQLTGNVSTAMQMSRPNYFICVNSKSNSHTTQPSQSFSELSFELMVNQPSDDSVLAYAKEQAAEAAELRLKVKHLERRLRRAEKRLETIYSSWTWKIGRIILFPLAIARWLQDRITK